LLTSLQCRTTNPSGEPSFGKRGTQNPPRAQQGGMRAWREYRGVTFSWLDVRPSRDMGARYFRRSDFRRQPAGRTRPAG
jgi:hypothetical protein